MSRLSRSEWGIISILRSGHAATRAWKKKVNLFNCSLSDDLCPTCEVRDNVQHRILECDDSEWRGDRWQMFLDSVLSAHNVDSLLEDERLVDRVKFERDKNYQFMSILFPDRRIGLSGCVRILKDLCTLVQKHTMFNLHGRALSLDGNE